MMGIHTTTKSDKTTASRLVHYKEVGDGWLAHRDVPKGRKACPIGYGRTRLAALEALTDNERQTMAQA